MNQISNRYHPALWIGLATLLVWGVTLSFGFVWDDFPMIAANSSLHQGSIFWRGWIHDFWMLHDSPQVSGYWRPVPTMIHAILTQFTPASAWVFHAFNVVLHFLTALFFYRFLVHIRLVKWFWVSVLFFLWHPINAEAVSFNSAIPDLLCAMFGFVALMVWTDERLLPQKKMVWTLFALALSFLSKESGVFFGVFIIGMEFFLHRDAWKQKAKFHGTILLLIIGYVFLHLALTRGIGSREIWGQSMSIHLATVCKLFLYQLFLIFFPVGSSPTRDLALGSWATWESWVGLLALLSAVGTMVYFRKVKPVLAFGIFFYLVFWFPVSNIIPGEGLIADRYLYMPSIAVSFLLGLLLNRCSNFPKLLGFFLIGWAIWAVQHSLVWKNSESLWAHAVEVSPLSSVAWNEWGNIHASKRNYQLALEAYERSLQLKPQYRDASYNRALAMYFVKDPSAMSSIKEHLSKFPDDAQALDLYGSYFEAMKDFESAEKFSKKAVLADPLNWKYHYNLASVYLQLKKYEEANVELENAYMIAPHRYEVLKNLAASYCLNASYKKCLNAYEELVRKFPEHTQEVLPAMEQAEQLLELTKGS